MRNGLQKRGDSWSYRIRVGDRLVGEGGYVTREEAEAARDKARVAAREGRLPAVPTRETVAAYLARWLTIHTSQVKPATLASYRTHVDTHIVPALRDLPLKKLNRATLATFYGGLSRRARPRGKETAPGGGHRAAHRRYFAQGTERRRRQGDAGLEPGRPREAAQGQGR
jgi:hypothetical protein